MVPWWFWSIWFVLFAAVAIRILTVLLDIRDTLRSINLRILRMDKGKTE